MRSNAHKLLGESGQIDVFEWRNNVKVIVESQPIKNNTITYNYPFMLFCAIEESDYGDYIRDAQAGYTDSLRVKLGSDTATASSRSTKGVTSAFAPSIEKDIARGSGEEVMSGTVIGMGDGGSHAVITWTLTVTFGAGTFSGAQTIGEVGYYFETGRTAGSGGNAAGVDGLAGTGNTSNKYLCFARISVKDGDFSAVVPTAAQGVTIAYSISF